MQLEGLLVGVLEAPHWGCVLDNSFSKIIQQDGLQVRSVNHTCVWQPSVIGCICNGVELRVPLCPQSAAKNSRNNDISLSRLSTGSNS
jgi:hypothetical protein